MSANDDTLTSDHTVAPPLPYTFRQLECFLAVADHGAISKAAIVLNASDSAVSDALTSLETALGAELFKRRRSRGATLTSDGHAILQLARRIVVSGAELSAAVGRDADSIVGPVRVGLTTTLASVVLPRLLIAVEQEYPGVRIEYRTDDLESLQIALGSGELDLVVTFDVGVPPEYERSVIAMTEAVLAISDRHRLAGRTSVALTEVADEPMVLLDIHASRTHTLELMSSRGVTPRIAHRTAEYELCRSLVGRGLGYTLLLRRKSFPSTRDGSGLVYLPLDPRPRTVDILVIWPSSPLPPRVSAVVNCLKSLSIDFQNSMG